MYASDASRRTHVAYALAGLLSLIAVYNVVTGVYGGAIVTSVGVVVATLLGVLS